MSKIQVDDRLTTQLPEAKQPVREPPAGIDLDKPRRRWVRWVEWVAIVVTFALAATVITYLATRGGTETEPRFTGDMIASQLRENHFPAPPVDPSFTGDMIASEMREGGFVERQAVLHEQAPLPYATSIAAWNQFLAYEQAPLPYESSIAAWNEFLKASEP